MSRALTFMTLVILVGGAAWLGPGIVNRIRSEFHMRRVARDMENARPIAREFGFQLQRDVRFTNVQVGIWGHLSRGPIVVRGRVRSDADATELRRLFDALSCPFGVTWQVLVDTNVIGDAR